ncbi:MAG: hypothetical protein AVDCRST_MAG40-3355, partial [uncultured Gemmatimonadaceae bacterium]
GGVQGARRGGDRALGGVPAPGLRGALEHAREELGLPVPRVAVRVRRGGAHGAVAGAAAGGGGV